MIKYMQDLVFLFPSAGEAQEFRRLLVGPASRWFSSAIRHKRKNRHKGGFLCLVGVTGFGPATSTSRREQNQP